MRAAHLTTVLDAPPAWVPSAESRGYGGRRARWLAVLGLALLALLMAGGCGTTRWSDTKRTATEQLLISDAMDRAVSRVDLRSLAGKSVYLDAAYIKGVTDSEYLVSTIRQHMVASGCHVRDSAKEADYVIEVRVGAVGTDRHDLLFGVPATNIPNVLPVQGVPSSIPEIPLVTKTEQRGVAKIALFAYNRETGRPVWQSGIIPVESTAKDVWVFGAGPFQRGTIYNGTEFAGDQLNIPLVDPESSDERGLAVSTEAYFTEPEKKPPPPEEKAQEETKQATKPSDGETKTK